MPAEATGVEIPIGMSLDDAREALRALEAESKRSGRAVQAAVEPGARAFDRAGGSLLNYARAQRREAGAARYFVSELASIAPVTDGTKTALMGLTSALVGGLGVGTAIGIVTTGLQLYVQWLNREAEAERKARETAFEHARALAEMDRTIGGFYAKFREFAMSEEEKFVEGATAPLRERVAELDQQIELKMDELQALKDSGADKDKITALDREIDGLSKLNIRLRDRLDNERAVAREAAPLLVAEKKRHEEAEEAARREEERRTRAPQLEIEYANRIFEIDYNLQQEREKAEIEHENRLFTIDYEMGQAREQWEIEHANRIFEIDYELDQRRIAERRRAMTELTRMGEDGFRSLASAAAGELGKAMRSSRAYANAMRAAGGATQEGADLSGAAIAAMTQDILASFAQQSIVEALIYTAKGIAASVTPGMQGMAAGYFTAAATFGAAAAAAGTAAAVIGANRGMTQSERASVEEARERNAPTTPLSSLAEGTPSGGRGGPTFNVFFSGRALVTEPEVKRYLADLMQEARDSGFVD